MHQRQDIHTTPATTITNAAATTIIRTIATTISTSTSIYTATLLV